MGGLRFTFEGSSPVELEVQGYGLAALTAVEVEAHVSQVAGHRQVRDRMRSAQRALGEVGAVMEGRDIGTVVFPDAPVKLFLTAAPDVRESRRAEERAGSPPEVGRALHARDEHDARVNPLEPAPDAVVIDTTAATPEATIARALEIVRERLR